jgi:hypothetical protein
LGASFEIPPVSAILTDADGFLFIDGLLPLFPEECNKQSRECEDQPLDRNPPPADQQPPEKTMVLVFDLDLVDHLRVDVCAAAFRTDHFPFLLFQTFVLNIRFFGHFFQYDTVTASHGTTMKGENEMDWTEIDQFICEVLRDPERRELLLEHLARQEDREPAQPGENE